MREHPSAPKVSSQHAVAGKARTLHATPARLWCTQFGRTIHISLSLGLHAVMKPNVSEQEFVKYMNRSYEVESDTHQRMGGGGIVHKKNTTW